MSISPQVAAFVGTLDKETLAEIARNVVASHELGCACAFCEFVRSRYPSADMSDADVFEREGGAHQAHPFDAEATIHLASIAKSLSIVASAVSGLRDIFRGRNSENEVVQSPYRALIDHFLKKPAPTAGPSTQRTPAPQMQPAQQQLPMQPVQQSLTPTGKEKRVATDQEYRGLKLDQKIPNLDLRDWPGESHKGRTLLQCEPQFLDVYADWKERNALKAKAKATTGAELNDFEKKDAQWGELNAAQYRRLAIEMRAGNVQRQAPAPTPTASSFI